MQSPPRLIVVAGPNGVGKSTYSRSAFAAGFLLLDPDRYGTSANVQSPVATGRLVHEALATGESFVLETTLSGRFPLTTLHTAHGLGYEVTLLYVGVDDPNECVRRVRMRVALGGHDVPEADIRRRFARSMMMLPRAIPYADRIALYENGMETPYWLIAQRDRDSLSVSRDVPQWAAAAVDVLRAHPR